MARLPSTRPITTAEGGSRSISAWSAVKPLYICQSMQLSKISVDRFFAFPTMAFNDGASLLEKSMQDTAASRQGTALS